MHVDNSWYDADITVAASGKLIDENRERQVGVEQQTKITNAGWRLYGTVDW